MAAVSDQEEMVKKTRELRALAQRATPQAAAAAITRRRQAAATRREEDQRALLSEAATLRGALFRSLSESPRDVYNRPRLEHFDLANWNGGSQSAVDYRYLELIVVPYGSPTIATKQLYSYV